MSWFYTQKTGVLNYNQGVLCVGYSGCEEGKNNPALQHVRNKGPIPRGKYILGETFTSSDHGPVCIRLIPDAANEMFGRDAFLVHGDSKLNPGKASKGCVIMPLHIRQLMTSSNDRAFEVL